jgi:hypothetical protein
VASKPDPADAELFKAHLQKYLENLVCPICKSAAWEVGGPVAEVGYNSRGYLGATGDSTDLFPLAFMICTTCFYVHQFAWIPMKAASKKNG